MRTQRATVPYVIDEKDVELQVKFYETDQGFEAVSIYTIRFGFLKEMATHRVWQAVQADLYSGGPLYDALLQETQFAPA